MWIKAWLCVLLPAAITLAQPRLLLNEEDFARIGQWAEEKPWAAQARNEVIAAADSFPRSYLQKYGLESAELPADGGQWSLWYVCPTHGVSLRYTAPNTHTCTVDNRNFSGWPYDQVIFERRHYDLAYAARDNGLAYRLTGRREFGEKAAALLLQYADRYRGYPIKDKDNRPDVRSGARVGAQTLDEAIWLIPVAWAYDLLAGSDVLTDEQRQHIEADLLRAAVETIQRNDAGVSNWQSWHNAGIGAAGFAMNDANLIREAIDGKSGFRFQMEQSVLDEGFWYEGAWSYHFYALDALVQLAEMAARNGVDLYGSPNLRNMFLTPTRLVFGDGSLPAFNDSRAVSLFSYARLYDMAYARYGDPLLASIAGQQTRGRNSLFWGAADVPRVELRGLASEVFPSSGYAALRAKESDHSVTMKYGPHGGGHGHYDKLGIVSFANGGILAVDPGTQSYAAPTHASWDKATVAHNTVVIDERSQGEAAGKLRWHQFHDLYSAASAEAGPAYRDVQMQRTLLVTREYALDLFRAETTDGAEHQIDWVYHNSGTVRTALPLAPYQQFPRSNGYQHLSKNGAAVTAEAWRMDFDGSREAGGNYGTVFRSNTSVQGAFQYSSEQAAAGRNSGKIAYQFSGAGYLLVGTAPIPAVPDAIPAGLTMMVYGDGSGHALGVRINDATDERFVIALGTVDWNGWKRIEVTGLARGSHYLGNNDGIIDTPIRSVSLELTRREQARQDGALYVDEIRLQFGDGADFLVADFEQTYQSLRLWMLPAAGTTVVTGEGLGPDLLRPVPFVMARRRARSTEFVSLWEPYQSTARILKFERTPDGTLRVEGPDFADSIRIDGQGVASFTRN